ncbi:Arc family DNA-binding protein [Pseudomonas syringae]|uniref:Arc family DNA-binding protein n=1 Tax=Pseudomonas syringae TaxID=317 RepID=UPI001F3CC182|nr:Arc family DNA-binding protein [Pseudomonas syringae]MCF5179634.1 Arc family DNA-binding protein [Pseudomonas syringae]MCF5312482.1 Arc family DNA-binding protein [Pseudomonas syringae]MCF5361095.1 Arc family DNA-binding protein [Pseudomonas syringae]MCF5391519.1 Arc family DNA-binding protein [Pseudomonas syringae]MCF5398016.1 Arc family DNA-binding protein [Pseudomonas syringae]
MSREDSQFKLRMPAELRDAIELAAKERKRSLNAEIVARLESSVLEESIGPELLSAAKAKKLSAEFRKGIPDEVKRRIVEAINYSVVHGLSSAHLDLIDLDLESLPNPEANALSESFSGMLADAGYEVEWDGLNHLWISFE